MTLEEAKRELVEFVKLKTTQQPVFLSVILDAIPAADVVEVRHGIPDPIEEVYEDTDGAHVYRHIVGYACPFCGSDRIAKYCADCGAKMDEEDKQ